MRERKGSSLSHKSSQHASRARRRHAQSTATDSCPSSGHARAQSGQQCPAATRQPSESQHASPERKQKRGKVEEGLRRVGSRQLAVGSEERVSYCQLPTAYCLLRVY